MVFRCMLIYKATWVKCGSSYDIGGYQRLDQLFQWGQKPAGKKRMEKPRYYYPGEKRYRMIYLEYPFGNIVEIYSHSYELIYSEGAY